MVNNAENRSHFATRFVIAIAGILFVLSSVVNRHSIKFPTNDSRSLLQWNPSSSWSVPSWSPPTLASVVEDVVPFYKPNQYSLLPVTSFGLHHVCTDETRLGCNENNTIRFTAKEYPSPYEFRYHNTGPEQLQGVFWTQQDVLAKVFAFTDNINFARTDLVSFARTNHGGGVQTGILKTDGYGYEYVMRPLGDYSWSISANAPDTYTSATDVLYLYDLISGTLDNPLAFEIIPNVKLVYDCARLNFGKLTNAFARFEMTLLTDPEDAYRKMYPGSVVWKRTTTYLMGMFKTEYLSVQVVDGEGNPIYPAWLQFQQYAATTIVAGLQRNHSDDRLVC